MRSLHKLVKCYIKTGRKIRPILNNITFSRQCLIYEVVSKVFTYTAKSVSFMGKQFMKTDYFKGT